MSYTRSDIIELLNRTGLQMDELLHEGASVRDLHIGNGVYLRGLIEYSNVCRKNCYYCGLRCDNRAVERYTLSEEQVLNAARFAYESNYGSIVLQGGESTSESHIATIESLIAEIKQLSNNSLGITLSIGEQSLSTYQRWFDAGAHRYLLRIESSSPDLYNTIHPNDENHRYGDRLMAIENLRKAGFQVGTGVMIGLPGQTIEHLANDLMFMKDMDIDMCGMGPYVVCDNTPLAARGDELLPEQWRFDMTLKMIASLRLLMPTINIAATTALQAIDPMGRLKALESGANVIMPNISPSDIRAKYQLYNNKPLSFDSQIIESRVRYGEWGDSLHFAHRKKV